MITQEDFPIICRLCMCNGEFRPISQLTTLHILTALTQIDVNVGNLPTNVCYDCIAQLDNIYKFIENCQNCNTILETLAEESHLEVANYDVDSTNIELERVKIDIDPSFQSLNAAGKKIKIKTKPYEIEEVFMEVHPILKCFECGETYSTKRALATHMISHKKDKIHQCKNCSATFPYVEYLTRHTLNVHGTKPFVCEICQEGFLRKKSLEDHKNFHTGETPYICSHCGQGFKVARHFNKHMYLLHNPNLSKIPKSKRKYVEKRVHLSLECKECGKIFASRYGFANHQLIHKGVKKFLCNVCGKQFLANAQLQNHLKHHKEIRKHFKCTECDKTFTKEKNLCIHLSKIHKDNMHNCSHCGKMCKTKEDLAKHLHLDTNSSQLSSCENTYTKKSTLNLFKCEICAKKFSYASHLNTHMRVHNGEKPYMCSVCGKLFSQKQTLTVHMRIHIGVTPFECTKCDKKYHDSTNLKRHFKRHHETNTK